MSENKKSVVRISKNGNKYVLNIERYQKRLEEEKRKRREEGGLLRTEYRKQRTKPYCHTIKNDAYLRYYEKKCKVREEYPAWNDMERNQWLSYFTIILDMIYGDEDFKQYREETKTREEREDDIWWDRKKEKEDDYDGSMDEYHM